VVLANTCGMGKKWVSWCYKDPTIAGV